MQEEAHAYPQVHMFLPSPAYGFTVFSQQVIKTCQETHQCADKGSEEEKCKQGNFRKNCLLQMITRLEMCSTCLLGLKDALNVKSG